MNKNLTIENVERELLRIMNENPDFKYSDVENYPDQETLCFYNRGKLNGAECDGCIFGQALRSLGVKEVGFADEGYEGQISEVWGELTGELIPEYWELIQDLQDLGSSWGDLRKYLPNNK